MYHGLGLVWPASYYVMHFINEHYNHQNTGEKKVNRKFTSRYFN